ncbi:hypothetical protein HPP92_029165 [Vanilla planifolia]|uniref:Uncharacterized protein n=1 Tax=Vanilla planifolia TaxID=51239 RepID=A0A835P868_VANPL|nr:hypothetical protein HPP92_029165 [Vanilla planifolia]KAG0445797.1 hypothetical protein HPP92_029154 [Vanilla planifolia]
MDWRELYHNCEIVGNSELNANVLYEDGLLALSHAAKHGHPGSSFHGCCRHLLLLHILHTLTLAIAGDTCYYCIFLHAAALDARAD